MPELTQTEYHFLILLRSALVNRTAKKEELSDDFNINDVLRLAYHHKLWHMILSAIPKELLPNNIDCRAELFKRISAQASLTSSFLRLWTSMQQAGFHPFVVKGILCRSIYPQPELRPSSDEDLYISDEEFESCCCFLQSKGLTPSQTTFSDHDEIGWKGSNGIYIELHRNLFEGKSLDTLKDFFAIETLKKESYPTQHGISVDSMTPHVHFLYLLLHAYKHFIHSGFGIRQICDIGLWAQKYGDRIDWEKLSEQCDTAGIKSFAAAIFGIAKLELNLSFDIPENWERPIEYCMPMLKDTLAGGIYGTATPDRIHSVSLTLNSVGKTKKARNLSILRSVFPTVDSLTGRYPLLKKYPFLLPAAWISRIISYTKRNLSGQTQATQSIAIGKERIELLRFYDIIK